MTTPELSASDMELTIALACVSVLEDCDTRSLTWVGSPSAGIVHCAVCSCDLNQHALAAHLQCAPPGEPVSRHRRCRHEQHTKPACDADSAGIIEESLEQAYERWRLTCSLAGMGQFIALERSMNDTEQTYYCQWCRELVHTGVGDNMALLAHMRKWQHARAQQEHPSVDWLAEVRNPALRMEASPLHNAKDIEAKIDRNLRKRIHACADLPAWQLFGCPLRALRQHIESQWTEGMSWTTYGSWHLDHKLPVCAFDTSNPVHCLVLCHYSNIAPMWGHENLAKGDKLQRACAPQALDDVMNDINKL